MHVDLFFFLPIFYRGLSNSPALFSSASVAAASITWHLNSSGEFYQIIARTIFYMLPQEK